MNGRIYDEIFRRAASRQAGFTEVPMDHTDILILSEFQEGAIATRRLGGCSGVVVLGRTAAIMAHIAPRQPGADPRVSSAEQHFRDLLGDVERLYTTHRSHFPPEATAWGFYVAGFDIITNEFRAIAARRFGALGLANHHDYYRPAQGTDRGDRIRACVRLLGQGTTLFYIEDELRDTLHFPIPLPEREAAQLSGRESMTNFLAWSDAEMALAQISHGRRILPDRTRLSGIYDIHYTPIRGRATWKRFNFDTNQWIVEASGRR